MTTHVHIKPAGHAVLVTISDYYRSPQGLTRAAHEEQIHLPGDPDVVLYSTTNRTITVVDLEPDDPRVIETEIAIGKRKPLAPERATDDGVAQFQGKGDGVKHF
jgi:hypothetical protein